MALFKKSRDQDRESEEIRMTNVIDFDVFLAEITPDRPSGDKDMEYDPAFIEIEEECKGKPEIDIGGKIVQEAKEPNWKFIQSKASDLLVNTHDLRIALMLTKALIHNEGLMGLRDGLRLILGFIEHFWDTLYPQLSPEDNHAPTQRINIMMELCDHETMISPLMRVALCKSAKMGTYCLGDIRRALGKTATSSKNDNPEINLATIEAAFKDCDAQSIAVAATATGESIKHIVRLETLLEAKISKDKAPKFDRLHNVLDEIKGILSQHLPKRGNVKKMVYAKKKEKQKPIATKPVSPNEIISVQGVKSMDSINSRQDVAYILDQLCLYYEKHEPASPVPLLLKRAKGLVGKNFYEIVQDMAPESVSHLQNIIGTSKEDDS